MNLLFAVDDYQFNGGGYGFSIHRLKMKLALQASGRMHKNFTWKQAAEKFIDICKKHR